MQELAVMIAAGTLVINAVNGSHCVRSNPYTSDGSNALASEHCTPPPSEQSSKSPKNSQLQP